MELKLRFLSTTLTIALTATANAEIIKCKNFTGQMVFTDDPGNCADKGYTESLNTNVPYNDAHFYNEIPDLLQTFASANFAGDGQQFCAPVAVSNSLVWFENNKNQEYQIDLVKKLSSSNYMNTNIKNGTNVFGVIRGVHKYAIERWNGYKTLEYSGWSKAPEEFRSHLEKPTLNWMTQALHPKGTVWLNIGWYKVDGSDYRRTGGHWVTLVGYEQGKLVVHDPAPRSGRTFSNQFISVRILNNGQLINSYRKTNARNHFIIEDGMSISSKAQFGIIDGAVKFELN